MSTGHALIPINDEQLNKWGMVEYLEKEFVFIPTNLPHGRFPTRAELRHFIQELGYELEETYDWYVTSNDDFTEIWFRGENMQENSPVEFWFRRGEFIVLNIAQVIANHCGSVVAMSHSGYPSILCVPEEVFPSESPYSNPVDYFQVIAHRLPTMVERLSEGSSEDKLFILSQIRQALKRADRLYQYELFKTAEQGSDTYKRLLNHEDARIRYLAFDLIARFRDRFFENSEVLRLSIHSELDTATKTGMIYGVEHLIVPSSITGEIYQSTKGILDVLSELNNNDEEKPPVRLAAAHLLARSQPGLLTPVMRHIFINALIHPDHYDTHKYSGYSITNQVLKSIEKMLLNHRIEILLSALPEIAIAQYAHEVLRALLDHVFFGTIRTTVMSSLPDTRLAERPEIDQTKFDKDLSRNWLYPANPTKLTVEELLPFQRNVLETVLALDNPWMVHSNLLEKYGFPPTRPSVRTLLDTSSK